MQEGQDNNQPGWVYSPDGGAQALPPVQSADVLQINHSTPSAQATPVAPPTTSPIPTPTPTPTPSQPTVSQPPIDQPQVIQPQTKPTFSSAADSPSSVPSETSEQPKSFEQTESIESSQSPSVNRTPVGTQDTTAATQSINKYGQAAAAVPPSQEAIRWTASEYVNNEKNSNWFMLLAIGAIVVAIIIYLVSRDIFSVVVVIVLSVAVGMFGARKPDVREYAVEQNGVHIGPKQFAYDTFKSFSVMQQDAINYITLMPTKRFMPPMALYFSPEQEDSIVDALSEHLPYEEREHDLVDRLSHKIRF